MSEARFEAILDARLRAYAEGGVRPIDRYAIAGAVIGERRGRFDWLAGLAPTGQRWLVPVLLAALLLALLASLAIVGAFLLRETHLSQRVYTGVLEPAPDIPTEMTRPVVLPLIDGRVLVLGSGSEGFGTPTVALLYDVETGSSTLLPPFAFANRSVSSAVRLLDGRVFISGGDMVEIFDPVTLQFASAGPMVEDREYPALAILRDGRVLVAGGQSDARQEWLTSAELFDPETLTFSATGDMTTQDSSDPEGAIATLPDGRVFMAWNSYEVYDPEADRFTTVGYPGFTVSHAIVIEDGRVVLFGTSGIGTKIGHAAVWDPASNMVSPLFTRPDDPINGATLLDDGRILLTGATSGKRWAGIYDPQTNALIRTETPSAWWPSATRLSDGRVLFVGGVIDGQLRSYDGGVLAPAVRTVEIFQ